MVSETRTHAARANVLGSAGTILISVVQAFVLMPLCLEMLGARLYGAWLGAAEVLAWIQLLDLGIPNLMAQRIGAAVGAGDRDATSRWCASGLTALAGVSAVLAACGMLASPAIALWMQAPGDAAQFTWCLRVGVVASAVSLVANGVVGMARGVQRTSLMNASSVAGAMIGFGVAVQQLLAGAGLWALAAGLAARAAVVACGAAVFLWHLARAQRFHLRPDTATLREITGLVPPMAAASVGYVVANHSEILLVGGLFGPVLAATYALTRRVVDGIRSVLDTIAWSTYGGFAHLVGSDQRHRSRRVLAEVLSLRFAAACVAAAVYIAVNRSFVTLLFGAEHFGGLWLTVAFALQMIVAGHAFLLNFLYRAAGGVREGSILLACEALVRVIAMIIGLRLGGLIMAPLLSTLTSAVALSIAAASLGRSLPAGDNPSRSAEVRRQLAAAGLVVAGIAIGASAIAPSWTAIVVVAALLATFGAGGLLALQPRESVERLYRRGTPS